MMCGWAKEQIAASWMYTSGSGELEPGDQAKLRHHLAECAECAEEMAQWCGERLAAHKVPRYIAFLDGLPHTSTHKIAKSVLRQDNELRASAVDLQGGHRPTSKKA